MKRPIPYPEARRILGRTNLANAFWLCTNDNLRSLVDLSAILEDVDDDVFRYHVTRDKNDFETWIRDTVKDKELAREIARVKTKETLIRKINERLSLLKKIVGRHKPKVVKKKTKKIKRKAKKRSKRKVKRSSKKTKRSAMRTAKRTPKKKAKRTAKRQVKKKVKRAVKKRKNSQKR